tara:strand:- start:56 stop:304 length:249 start_codon:yes stop_codon:yes gene_type:complete
VSTKKEKPKRKNSGGVRSGPPPKKGPNSQGIDAPIKSILEKETVEYLGLKKGGCPHRESSSKNTYPGHNSAQIKGFKFIGVR